MLARRNLPLLAAFACLLGLIVVGVLALLVPAGHERDAAMLHGFVGLDRPSVRFKIKVLAHLGDTLPYTCAGLVCVGVALVRGRGWRALAAAVLLVATGATTEASSTCWRSRASSTGCRAGRQPRPGPAGTRPRR